MNRLRFVGPVRSLLSKMQLDYSIYRSLLLKFLLAMLLFSISRIGFYLINQDYYPDMDLSKLLGLLRGGLVFDLTAVLYINAIFLFLNLIPFKFRKRADYQRALKYWFFATNGLGLLINCADIIYFQFTSKRTTASVFDAFAGEPQMGILTMHYIVDYWYVTLFWLLLIGVMVWFYGRVHNQFNLGSYSPTYYVTNTVTMLVVAFFTVVGIRGGFTGETRPINLNNAGKYVEKPIEMALVLNTPFCLIRTIDKKAPVSYSFFDSEAELNAVYTPVYIPGKAANKKKENVMIIILESFSREYMGSLNPDIGNSYTPFLDSLVSEGLAFENAYANGMKSIDGLPAVVSSIPALVHPFVLSHGSTNSINSVAGLLKTEGYNSTYFYGGPNGSMGYDAFVNLAGFDQYIGKKEYNNDSDYDGVWGIWDEEFFQFTAESMEHSSEPFCNVLMSVSSHHPFKVPEKHQERFNSPDPFERVIGYTDYALKRFFERVSTMDWFENTLFVITADHSSGHFAPHFKTTVGLFAVPIIFYKPGSELKGKLPGVAQQIDILPTVLNYLQYDQPYVAFGNDLFNDSTNHFAINYVSGSYQIISDQHALQFDGERTFGLFDYKQDRLMENNLMEELPEVKLSLELNLKARIQQYNDRLSSNSMSVDQLEISDLRSEITN